MCYGKERLYLWYSHCKDNRFFSIIGKIQPRLFDPGFCFAVLLYFSWFQIALYQLILQLDNRVMEQMDVRVSFYLKKSETNADGCCPVMARLTVGNHSSRVRAPAGSPKSRLERDGFFCRSACPDVPSVETSPRPIRSSHRRRAENPHLWVFGAR